MFNELRLHADLVVYAGTFVLRETLQETLANAVEETLLALDYANGRDTLLLPRRRVRVVHVNVSVWREAEVVDELRELRKLEEREGRDLLVQADRVASGL